MRRLTTMLAAAALLTASATGSGPKPLPAVSHFTWSAEAGGAIDLTSNDLSTIDLSACFGYRNSWIDMLGVGASINMMVSDSHRAFPVYAVFRSNFSRYTSPCFLDMRAGCVFDNVGDQRQTRLYLSPGLGINLASGSTFQSYITLSYVYNGLSDYSYNSIDHHLDGLHMAAIRLGIAF